MKKLFLLIFILCFNNSTFAMFRKMNDIFNNAIDRLQLSNSMKSGIKEALAQNADYKIISKLSPRKFASEETHFEELLENIITVASNQPIEKQLNGLNVRQDFLVALEDGFLKNISLKDKAPIIEKFIETNRQLISKTKDQIRQLDPSKSVKTLSVEDMPRGISQVQGLQKNELLEQERKSRIDSDLPSDVRFRSIISSSNGPKLPPRDLEHGWTLGEVVK